MTQAQNIPTRGRKNGVVLLWALVMSSIALVLMSGYVSLTYGNQRLAAGLVGAYRDDAAAFAISERLIPAIAQAMENSQIDPREGFLPLDGTAISMIEDGRTWVVQVQDVEGLVDPYLASPEILTRLPNAAGLAQSRDEMLAQLPPGGRYPVIELTLRRLGVPPQSADLFTQSSSFGYPRLQTAPLELRSALQGIGLGLRDAEQVETVRISISRKKE
jgi:hypothetical protein